MSKYSLKFELITEIPTDNDSANRLARQMNEKCGGEGWKLTSVTPISTANLPGMLLTFQKEIV